MFSGFAVYYRAIATGATSLYHFCNSTIDAQFYIFLIDEKDAVRVNLPDYQLNSNDDVAFISNLFSKCNYLWLLPFVIKFFNVAHNFFFW